jgi:hypothetical protein
MAVTPPRLFARNNCRVTRVELQLAVPTPRAPVLSREFEAQSLRRVSCLLSHSLTDKVFR